MAVWPRLWPDNSNGEAFESSACFLAREGQARCGRALPYAITCQPLSPSSSSVVSSSPPSDRPLYLLERAVLLFLQQQGVTSRSWGFCCCFFIPENEKSPRIVVSGGRDLSLTTMMHATKETVPRGNAGPLQHDIPNLTPIRQFWLWERATEAWNCYVTRGTDISGLTLLIGCGWIPI